VIGKMGMFSADVVAYAGVRQYVIAIFSLEHWR